MTDGVEPTKRIPFIKLVQGFLGPGADQLRGEEWVFRHWLDGALSEWHSSATAKAFAPFDGYFPGLRSFPEEFVDFLRFEIADQKFGTSSGLDMVCRKLEAILDISISRLADNSFGHLEPHSLQHSPRVYDRNIAGDDPNYLDEFILELFSILMEINEAEAYAWAERSISPNGALQNKKMRNNLPAPLALFNRINRLSTASEAKPEFFKQLFEWARLRTNDPTVPPALLTVLQWRLHMLYGPEKPQQALRILENARLTPVTKHSADTGLKSIFLALESYLLELEQKRIARGRNQDLVKTTSDKLRSFLDHATLGGLEALVEGLDINAKENFRASPVLLSMFSNQLDEHEHKTETYFDVSNDVSMFAMITSSGRRP